MQPLTEQQKRILRYIEEFISEKGYPPTVREIAERFGYRSPLAAKFHLDALVRKGYIKRHPKLSRGIEVISRSIKNMVQIPVVGRIRAGEPSYAEEDVQEYLKLDREIFRIEDAFGLVVTGESMKDAGIHEGDIIIVAPNREPSPGSIVVACIDDEVTVKRFFRKGRNVVLRPDNPEMKEIVVSPERVRIIGKVVGLVRRF